MRKQSSPVLVPLLLSALLAGCGSETAHPPETEDVAGGSFVEPQGLTCPTDGRVGSSGGLLAEWPDGPDTAAEVVDAESTPEQPWVLVGRKAYELRPDGTAFKVHDLVNGPKGWFLGGYEACG